MREQLIKEHAATIPHLPNTLDAEAILWAIYHCEKYDENNKVPRFEKSYAPGGYYYVRNQVVRINYERWGRAAACSYSNFQILYATAHELGYPGPPLALDTDAVALPYVCRYIHKRILDKGATTPEQVADAYNSGSFQDNNHPESYMRKFRKYYDRALRIACKDTTKTSDDSTIELPISPEE